MAEDLSLQWRTPTGFPWVNSYDKQRTKQVKLFLHSLGVSFRVLLTTGEGLHPEIDKRKAKNGVAPNFVRACDAAHLMRTVNAAVAEGITSIATVHDSFGCLPSRAERFRKIIREEFVRMYEEHDVLAEVLDQARAELGGNTRFWMQSLRLPEPLSAGQPAGHDVETICRGELASLEWAYVEGPR